MPMIDAKHLAEDGKRFQLMKKLAKKMLDQLQELMDDDKAVKSLAGSERPGHKYIRREPKAGGGHKYVYRNPMGRLDPNGGMTYDEIQEIHTKVDEMQRQRGFPPLRNNMAALKRLNAEQAADRYKQRDDAAELDKFASIEQDNMPNNAWIARRPDGSTIRKHEDVIHSYRHGTREGAETTRLKAYKASQTSAAKPETKKARQQREYEERSKKYHDEEAARNQDFKERDDRKAALWVDPKYTAAVARGRAVVSHPEKMTQEEFKHYFASGIWGGGQAWSSYSAMTQALPKDAQGQPKYHYREQYNLSEFPDDVAQKFAEIEATEDERQKQKTRMIAIVEKDLNRRIEQYLATGTPEEKAAAEGAKAGMKWGLSTIRFDTPETYETVKRALTP